MCFSAVSTICLLKYPLSRFKFQQICNSSTTLCCPLYLERFFSLVSCWELSAITDNPGVKKFLKLSNNRKRFLNQMWVNLEVSSFLTFCFSKTSRKLTLFITAYLKAVNAHAHWKKVPCCLSDARSSCLIKCQAHCQRLAALTHAHDRTDILQILWDFPGRRWR